MKQRKGDWEELCFTARKWSKECRLLEVVGMLLVTEVAPEFADIFTFGSS